MRRRPLAVLFLTSLLTACASSQPDPTRVKVTTNQADVLACKNLGLVDSDRPAQPSGPDNSRMQQMREKAARLGGDTLYLKGGDTTGTGTVYRCGAKPSIQ